MVKLFSDADKIMILHNDSSFLIYFGDSGNCCVKSKGKFSSQCFNTVTQLLDLDKLIFLNQTHSCDGVSLFNSSDFAITLDLFNKDGDFLVTNLSKVGIGVLTADCLPVIFYDPVNCIAAIAHSGWRGSVDGISQKVIEEMQQKFKTKTRDLIVYFAPSAKACCYQVGQDFIVNLDNSIFLNQVILKRNEKYFFDLPKFVRLQLLDLGVEDHNIRQTYNDCTICNHNFCSYRRDGAAAARQLTVVVLK